jgi:hypothetical protein
MFNTIKTKNLPRSFYSAVINHRIYFITQYRLARTAAFSNTGILKK